MCVEAGTWSCTKMKAGNKARRERERPCSVMLAVRGKTVAGLLLQASELGLGGPMANWAVLGLKFGPSDLIMPWADLGFKLAWVGSAVLDMLSGSERTCKKC